MNPRDLDPEGLRRLNSATKYPSIPTYHEMGERGALTDTVAVSFDGQDDLVVTEKIDGTNARILWFPAKCQTPYIIGSRNEFLHARGDLIPNPKQGIVAALQPLLERISGWSPPGALYVLYGEVYGGSIGKAAKQYTSSGTTGFRLFDALWFTAGELSEILAKEPEQIASWRDHGGQRFEPQASLERMGQELEIPVVPPVPIHAPLPRSVEDTKAWLSAVSKNGSSATLDDGAGSVAEGVVVRTSTRSKIAKLRVEDYERTLRRKAGVRERR